MIQIIPIYFLTCRKKGYILIILTSNIKASYNRYVKPKGRKNRRPERLWIVADNNPNGIFHYPIEVWHRKGNIHDLIGQWQQAEKIYRRNMVLAKECGLSELEAMSCNALGWVLHRQGQDDEAEKLFIVSRDIYRSYGDMKGLAKTCGFMGGVCYHQGRYAQALEFYNQQLEISQNSQDDAGTCVAYNNLANVLGEQGDLERAHEYYKKALELADDMGDTLRQATIIGNIGVIHMTRGDYAAAEDWLLRQGGLSEKAGDKHSLAATYANLAGIYLLTGRFEPGLSQIEKKIELSREMGDMRGLAVGFDYKALVLKSRKDLAGAEDLYLKAIEIGRQCNMRYYLCGFLFNLAQLYHELSRHEESIEMNRQAAEMASEIGESGTLNDSRILGFRIASITDPNRASEGLRKMLGEEMEEHHRAEITFWLYKLEGKEADRLGSLMKYQELYKQVPNHDYKVKIQELEKCEENGA